MTLLECKCDFVLLPMKILGLLISTCTLPLVPSQSITYDVSWTREGVELYDIR